MGLQPKIQETLDFRNKICAKCGRPLPSTSFLHTKSVLSIDGYTDWCANCLERTCADNSYSWDYLDLLCQQFNIPWVPSRFEEIHEANTETPFTSYIEIFSSLEYERLEWKEYFEEFTNLREAGQIAQELPRLKDDRLLKLHQKWGENYSEEQLNYLESLYQGMLLSQNINGALQTDQAKKLCKTSLEIDERIRAGSEYDKLLSSYDKLVKIAEFTPKNAKNIADFDSTGELFHWLEKRGWKNMFYDGVTRDVVDETMKNIEAFNQRLYTNESGIGEEITRRIEALKSATELENYYDTQTSYDLDNFENDGFEELLAKDDNFEADLNG